MVTISLSFYFLLYQMTIDDGRFYWWKCISFEIRLIEFPFALIHLPPSLCILFLAWIRYQLTLKIHLHHHFLFHCWYQSSSACRSNQFILKSFFFLILAIVCHTSEEPNLPNYQSNWFDAIEIGYIWIGTK